MIDSKQLRYFLAIAEELHFHKAADRLNITQPALSRQVRELERSIGAALFVRSSRRVELTAAGRELFGHGLRIMANLEQATVSVQRVASGEFGTIVFGYPHSASHFLVPELVKHFHRTYPNVEVDLRALTSKEQVDALRTGKIDVGLMRPGYDVLGVSSKLLVSESFVVAVPENHPLAGRSNVPLHAFEDDHFILHAKQIPGISMTYELILRFFERVGFTPRICHDAPDHIYLALGLVNAGVGVAIVPQSMTRVPLQGVSFCELAETTPPSEYALIWRIGDTDPRIELLADFIMPA